MIPKTSYDTLWHKRLNALNAVWPAFLAGDANALHKVRVASRRIREALPVVGVSASPATVKKLRRKLRNLTRFLGPIRELDVELGMLEREAAGDDVPHSALSLVRRELAARRHALRDGLGEEPSVAAVKNLIRKLERVGVLEGRRASKGKGRKARQQKKARCAALGATLLRRTRHLKVALDDAGPLYVPERIHAVRVATKKLRYALEIVQETGDARAKAVVAFLKREQERLGHLHDLEALLKHVREAEAAPGAEALLAGLTAYADLLDCDCRRLHAGFVGHRDAMFACVKEVRHQIVPAVAAPSVGHALAVPAYRRARGRATKRA